MIPKYVTDKIETWKTFESKVCLISAWLESCEVVYSYFFTNNKLKNVATQN